MTYEEKCEELRDEHEQESQNIKNIERIYRFAESIVQTYESFGSGDGRVQYYAGSRIVNVHLTSALGKHPIKECLILIDECSFPEYLTESHVPEGIGEGEDSIFWSFRDLERETWLYLYCQLRESGGCKQVGTGEYREVKIWKCL